MVALRLPLSPFEAQPLLLNRIPSRSLPPLSALVRAPPPRICRRKFPLMLAAIGKEDTEVRVSGGGMEDEEETERSIASIEADAEVMEDKSDSVSGELDDDVSSEDLESVGQIKRVLDILKKNRNMLFGEVKLTVMIEDPRDVERKRLLGIEDPDEVTRDDLAAALEDIHEGRIPKNRIALRLLTEEMINWPELEVEAPKGKRNKSLYARVTDTGVDPREAAKRLNIDWDLAADIEAKDEDEDIEVPSAVGYGALYLVTALPLIIGVSVVLILFYNSLQ